MISACEAENPIVKGFSASLFVYVSDFSWVETMGKFYRET